MYLSRLLTALFLWISFQSVHAQETTLSLYKKGLSSIQQKRYEEAVQFLEQALQSQSSGRQSSIYYLIGVAQYQNGQYANAINSFETALDSSTNTKLDSRIDAYIEKAIRMLNFEESIKLKHRLWYYLGIGYDSNVLNLNTASFPNEKLSSVSTLYGVGYAYRLMHTPDYSLIPEISVTDNYTMDSSFKTNSTVQSADALQFAALLPFLFQTRYASSYDYTRLTLGYKNIFLPDADSRRKSAFTSLFAELNMLLALGKSYYLNPVLFYSSDKSLLTNSTPDDDQTASRYGLEINNQILFGPVREYAFFVNLVGEMNQATGKNQAYSRQAFEYGISTTAVETYVIRILNRHQQTDYNKRGTQRHDKLSTLGLDATKLFSNDRALTLSYGNSTNTSDSELNRYQDTAVSLVFSDAFEF